MKTAFIFPGQGSQTVGMGKGLAEKHLAEASEILGFDLKRICFEGPEQELKKTEITQPAILTVSIAAFELLRSNNIDLPAAVAGHSLGEYSALVAAGALSFHDAVKLVHLRGKFMQEAVPLGEGAMSAVIGAENSRVEEVCREVGGVWPANFNSPGQVVISGAKTSVDAAAEKLKAAGAKRVVPLPVSAPFHCPLMQPAADRLRAELNKIQVKDVNIPLVANVTAAYVTNGGEISDLLTKQVTAPVRWSESVKTMIDSGVSTFVEVGPGNVLSGLVKRIARTAQTKTYQEVII